MHEKVVPNTKPSKQLQESTASLSYVHRYLAYRDIVTSSLRKFDDCPENDQAWKLAFLNAINGLCLGENEEIDLINEAAHVAYPTVGLRKA